MKLILLMAIFALLSLPAAAASVAVVGEFDSARGSVDGFIDVGATDGLLSLGSILTGVVVSWGSAQVWDVTRSRDSHRVGDIIETPTRPTEVTNDTYAWGPGSLQGLVCAAPCEITFFVWNEGEGTIGLLGSADGRLMVSSAERVQYVGTPDNQAAHSHARTSPAGTPTFRSAWAGPGTHLQQAIPRVEGRLGLMLWNVTGDIVGTNGTQQLVTGDFGSGGTTIGPATTGREVSARYLVITLVGASIVAPPGTSAWLDAPASTIALDGELRAEDAEGWLRVGNVRHELRQTDVTLAGLFSIELARGGLANVPGLGSWEFEATGEADRVLIGSVPVGGSRVTTDAAPLAAGIGFAVLLGLLARAGLFVFYTRIDRQDLLVNERRRRLFERIHAEPGRSVSHLAKEVGIPRPVARHHLAMLEGQRLVTARRVGRFRRIFPVEVTAPEAWQDVLEDQTRRAIARAIVGAKTPPTQRELISLTGASQRLVSYHVGRLARGGLVRVIGSRPLRYAPTDGLCAAVRGQGAREAAAWP